MKQKKFIHDLLDDLTPVKTLPSFFAQCFLVFLTFTFLGFFLLLFFGISFRLFESVKLISFDLILILSLFFVFFSVLSVLSLQMPGRSRFYLFVCSLFSLFGLGFSWFFSGPFQCYLSGQSVFYFESTFSCVFKLIMMGLLFLLGLFFVIRKGFFLYHRLASLMVFSASLGASLLVLSLHCYVVDYMHIFLWHLCPLFLCLVLGFYLGRRLFKK